MSDPIAKFESLTNRQKEVLAQVCKGNIYKDIADGLYISENTVKTHMGNIYEKLGLADLPKKKRLTMLLEVYCPLLQERPPGKDESDIEPEPVSPKVQQMVEEDENALVLYRSPEVLEADFKELQPIRNNRNNSNSGCRWRLVGCVFGGIILLVGAGIILWFAIQQFGVPWATAEPTLPPDSPSVVIATNTPIVLVVTATSPSTNTPIPTDTPLPTANPTDTPRPTNTPEPIPGGIGTGFGDDDFQLELIDYEFRSVANEEDEGAVIVYFSMINNTDSPVELGIDWYSVRGVDNLGITYGEIQSAGDRYFSWSSIKEKLENWTTVVPPNSVETLYFELQIEGNNAGHITRVDIQTDWIDLTFPSIVYRTDEVHQVTGKWRLDR